MLLPAGAAVATHEHPQSATSIHTSLVPVFKQCGTSGNPSNSSHAPPLSVGSCSPPQPIVARDPRFGSTSSGTVDYSVLPGDISVAVTFSDVTTATGADFEAPSPTSDDLQALSRVRFTDHYTCPPNPCAGPYNQPGTSSDLDLGPVPIQCVPNGDPATPPGSDCSVSTTFNTIAGSPVFPAGGQAVIQFFRTRVNDGYNHTLFAQQGIFVP